MSAYDLGLEDQMMSSNDKALQIKSLFFWPFVLALVLGLTIS